MSQPIRNSLIKTAGICASSLLFFSGLAMAHQIRTETFSLSGNVQDAGNSGQFTLPDFNSSLGTLQTVKLTLTLDASVAIQVYDASTASVNFSNASLTEPVSITGPGTFSLAGTLTASLPAGTAQPGINSYSPVSVNDTFSGYVHSSELSMWENQLGGNLAFTYLGNPTVQGTDLGNNLFFGGSTTGTGTITVSYTYRSAYCASAAPEPAGAYLSVIVAAAMGLMLARRKNFVS